MFSGRKIFYLKRRRTIIIIVLPVRVLIPILANRCKAVITWLETNTLADKEEFEDKLKDLQKECSPVMTKLHQAGAKGPNVEEVD